MKMYRITYKSAYYDRSEDIKRIAELWLGFLKNGMSDQDLIHTINKISEFLNLSVTITKE